MAAIPQRELKGIYCWGCFLFCLFVFENTWLFDTSSFEQKVLGAEDLVELIKICLSWVYLHI